MRDEPQVGDDAGCGNRTQCRRMVQDAGDEAASCLAQTVRSVGIVHHRPPGKIDQAHVNVDAVADDVRRDRRRKADPMPEDPGRGTGQLANDHRTVGRGYANGGRVGHLVLAGTILGQVGSGSMPALCRALTKISPKIECRRMASR